MKKLLLAGLITIFCLSSSNAHNKEMLNSKDFDIAYDNSEITENCTLNVKIEKDDMQRSVFMDNNSKCFNHFKIYFRPQPYDKGEISKLDIDVVKINSKENEEYLKYTIDMDYIENKKIVSQNFTAEIKLKPAESINLKLNLPPKFQSEIVNVSFNVWYIKQ